MSEVHATPDADAENEDASPEPQEARRADESEITGQPTSEPLWATEDELRSERDSRTFPLVDPRFRRQPTLSQLRERVKFQTGMRDSHIRSLPRDELVCILDRQFG